VTGSGDVATVLGVTVVVGVDGAGRTHRLAEIGAAGNTAVVRLPAPPAPAGEVAARLEKAKADGALVLVDDAHRLDAETLRTLAAAARDGLAVVVARRPTIDRPELAELDEAAAGGGVELLAPLSREGIAGLVNRVTGRPVPAEVAAAVLEASAGLPAIAAAVAAMPPGTPSPALLARVQRRLAVLDLATGRVARTLALRIDLTDAVLARAAAVDPPELAQAMRVLRDEGLLVPGGERMIPAVAEAVLAELSPAERRRVHDALAQALISVGGDPVAAATQLRAATVRTAAAAEAYRAAGERLRFLDPAAAIDWYDDAADAGAGAAALAAGRAEAAALLGLPVGLDGPRPQSPAETVRLALVEGAVSAHAGRTARAAETLVAAGSPGPVLAVPALMATGLVAAARRAAVDGAAPLGLRRLAEAALAAGDPADALPLAIEAAETVEQNPPNLVLPDTPHAWGAVVAVLAGDATSAEHLLGRALAVGVGGPAAADRHRLLLAWARMRSGRYNTAVAEIRRLRGASLPGRERLLLAGVTAGIARRSGDIARLRDTWAEAEQLLARRVVDVFQVELVEELAVAAARLRRQQRAAPVLGALDEIVDRLGRPPAWLVAIGWVRLQVAVAGEDADGAAAVAASLGALDPPGARQRAQRAAAGVWARLLAGEVDEAAAGDATDALAAAELPWEASRLAGQAAIRTTDAAAARRLLERARELSSAEQSAAADPASTDAPTGALSEREVEVARLVLSGRTHREIGAQLYIAPKTVEHHVARIRTKLGATNRAEFVAALRDLLDEAEN
jgi:DNA-binding NarL/FixJ family response regulator